jgi:hypothetical protein
VDGLDDGGLHAREVAGEKRLGALAVRAVALRVDDDLHGKSGEP